MYSFFFPPLPAPGTAWLGLKSWRGLRPGLTRCVLYLSCCRYRRNKNRKVACFQKNFFKNFSREKNPALPGLFDTCILLYCMQLSGKSIIISAVPNHRALGLTGGLVEPLRANAKALPQVKCLRPLIFHVYAQRQAGVRPLCVIQKLLADSE